MLNGLSELFAEYNVLGAFWMTIKLTVAAAIGALLIGTIVAIMRVSPVAVFRAAGTAYVTLVRNTPLTLIVFFCAFGFYITLQYRIGAQDSPIDVQNFRWGVLGLAVYHAAFVAEALRSGINTVPKGQAEAARAIGLDFRATLSNVVLPQAFRGAIAPLGNVLIALTKNTTVVATIGVAEASYLMKGMIEFRPDLIYVIFVIMATGFVILTLAPRHRFTDLVPATGGEAMSAEASVLFDAPGPKARRRYVVIAVIGDLGHPCAAVSYWSGRSPPRASSLPPSGARSSIR